MDCKLLLLTNCTLSPDFHPRKYNFICDVNNHDVWWTESTSTFISLIQLPPSQEERGVCGVCVSECHHNAFDEV